MPVRSYNKVEAKYNVTTDFPSLGLHSAAATGNLGLVEYALVHGQPVNSVLDGVLPLHAACAGGHVQVVKLLLEWGADVNAPRLPRRYSNDKNRDSSAPIVGTSGSTPLHFAAANGNANVVSILLLHGAHADRPDKHGVTPEMLAKQNGWLECAQVLRDWILNKDRDLKERETIISLHPSRSHDPSLSVTDAESSTSLTGRRRLQVKHSIDTALNMLKSPSCVFDSHVKSSARSTFSSNTPPASPTRPSESIPSPESPVGNGRMSPNEGSRRPSLPYIFAAPSRNPKASNPTSGASFLSARRPQSAGTGAGREDEEIHSARNASGRRLGSKYSLMNMFRKAHTDVPGASGSPDFRPGSSPKQALTVQATQSTVEPSGIADDSKKDRESTSSVSNRFHRGSDASSRSQPCSASPRSWNRRNIPNPDDITLSDDTNASTHKRVFSDVPRDTGKSSSPLSVMSILRVKDHNRERSCSNGSSYSIPARQSSSVRDEIPSTTGETEAKKGFPRPSILLGHSRSLSSGQSTPISSSYRALRFEYSLNDPEDIRSAELDHSLGSLARITARQDAQSHYHGLGIGRAGLPPASAPAGVPYFDKNAGGASPKFQTPLQSGHSPSIVPSTKPKEGRISSLSSSSNSSISLLAANDGSIAEDYGKYPMHSGLPSRSLPERAGMSMIHTLGKDIPGIRTGVANEQSKGSSAFEIDITTISSHAQAEALVQQTQKEILEMDEQETLLAEESPGNTPLSARLAAYGESLALERKFREEIQNQRKADHSERNGQLSPSTKTFSSVTPTRSHIRITRQHSFDEQFGNRKEAYGQGALQVPVESVKYDQSHSRPATSLGYNHQISDAHQTADIGEAASPISAQGSPIDSLEQDLEFGSPLFRISTAPLSIATNTDRSTIIQARNAKLTKMGFVPNEQARVPPTQTKGFGGLNFKNIMQTFKGKA